MGDTVPAAMLRTLYDSALETVRAERALADALYDTLVKVNAGPDSLGPMEEVQHLLARYEEVQQVLARYREARS